MVKEQLIRANAIRMGGIPMLMHRTMCEFGRFCQDLTRYLIWDDTDGADPSNIQFFNWRRIYERDLDLEDPEVYADLFLEYWELHGYD